MYHSKSIVAGKKKMPDNREFYLLSGIWIEHVIYFTNQILSLVPEELLY